MNHLKITLAIIWRTLAITTIIRLFPVFLWAFAIGSALAAVAGILITFDADMRQTMGFSWLLYGVVAMIIGGVDNNSSTDC